MKLHVADQLNRVCRPRGPPGRVVGCFSIRDPKRTHPRNIAGCHAPRHEFPVVTLPLPTVARYLSHLLTPSMGFPWASSSVTGRTKPYMLLSKTQTRVRMSTT